MADYLAAFDFIEKLEQYETVPELVAAFQNLIGKFGLTAFAVGEPGSPKSFKPDRIWASTWPEGWAKLWAEENFVSVDPVIYQLLAQNTPFRWADLRKRVSGKGAFVMDAAREFSLFDGFGVAVHSLSGGKAAVTMGGEACALSKRDETSIHLAAIYFFARVEKLLRKHEQMELPKLTPRERDCLSWVAAGKTDWETSQILGISESTVKEYVQAAMRKLDATHRAQAVALAIHAGVIAP